MSIEKQLDLLHANRLLSSQKEINNFDTALIKLIDLGEVSIIPGLCNAFDDDTEQHEVMFGLVHGIEGLYKDSIHEGLTLIVTSVPRIIDRAEEWVEILHFRILNNKQVRDVYAKVLSEQDVDTKMVLIKLLLDIKADDVALFSEPVDEILSTV